MSDLPNKLPAFFSIAEMFTGRTKTNAIEWLVDTETFKVYRTRHTGGVYAGDLVADLDIDAQETTDRINGSYRWLRRPGFRHDGTPIRFVPLFNDWYRRSCNWEWRRENGEKSSPFPQDKVRREKFNAFDEAASDYDRSRRRFSELEQTGGEYYSLLEGKHIKATKRELTSRKRKLIKSMRSGWVEVLRTAYEFWQIGSLEPEVFVSPMWSLKNRNDEYMTRIFAGRQKGKLRDRISALIDLKIEGLRDWDDDQKIKLRNLKSSIVFSTPESAAQIEKAIKRAERRQRISTKAARQWFKLQSSLAKLSNQKTHKQAA